MRQEFLSARDIKYNENIVKGGYGKTNRNKKVIDAELMTLGNYTKFEGKSTKNNKLPLFLEKKTL